VSEAGKPRLRAILLLLLPALVVLGGLLIWQQGGRYITSENAYVRADIVQIAPEVSGRVAEVLVRDHARVEAGTLLLRIDPDPFRLAVEKAEAELDAARSLVEIARATYRETQSELGELQARAEYLQRQARRQQELAARGVSPTTRLEETQNDADVARERVAALMLEARARSCEGQGPSFSSPGYRRSIMSATERIIKTLPPCSAATAPL
jgi:membrane fusion protein (multidrug efflux system)